MAESTNSRWWEFYFVRYFVGTVLGAIIVYELTVSPNSALSASLVPGVTKEISYPLLLLLGAYGLAYCYIASGPVLVLHATRSVFSNKMPQGFQLWFVVAAITGVIIFPTIMWATNIKIVTILAALLAYFVFMIQVIPLVFAFQKQGQNVTLYYQNLSQKRSNVRTDSSVKEYVESYRHLREHGNAFLIVVFEIAFAICLWNLPKDAIQIFAPAIVGVWVLPGSLVWFIGTVLESNMVSRDNS